jgi:hypothetical protein
MRHLASFVRLGIAGLIGLSAYAHVGSPDIYLDGKAGPYQLFITVRPPQVIPGVAELEIRSETPGVLEVRAVPVPMAGPGAKFAPVPDNLARSKEDGQFFTGSLWIMAPGSWEVRVSVDGDKGHGALAVPVPSAALRITRMNVVVGGFLGFLGVFLVGGMVAIAGASVREARLAPGRQPDARHQTRGRVAMAVALLVLAGVLWGGDAWWNSEARSYSQTVYRPTQMNALLDSSTGTLNLQLADSNWLEPAGGAHRIRSIFMRHSIDDLIPDHNHLMHLYAIREPALDVVYHLHPDQVGPGAFRLQLPVMTPGMYRLYADIVHANGFPETPVTDVRIPRGLPSRALSGDDASAAAEDWLRSKPNTSFALPDGYRMEWIRQKEPLHAKQATSFRFRLLDQHGQPPRDMALYMGMLGHAAFVKTDESVFAHIHPMGTASMAALALAGNEPENSATSATAMFGMNLSAMRGMQMQHAAALPNEVSFPYGFPAPGRYRIFVQMKHGTTVETGIFDAVVQ